MKQIILLRKLTKQEYSDLLNSIQNAEIGQVYYLNVDDLPSKKVDNNIWTLYQHEPQEDKVFKALREIISELGHTEIKGTTLIDQLSVGSQTYWYYFRYLLFYRSIEGYRTASLVQSICEKSGYNSFDVYAYNDGWKKLLSNLKVSVKLPLKKDKPGVNWFGTLSYFLFFLLRAVFGFFLLNKRSRTAKNLIILNEYDQTVINLSNNEIRIADPHMAYFTDLASQNDEFIFLSQILPPSLKGVNKIQWSRLFYVKYPGKTIFFETFLFLAFFKKKTYNRISKVKKMLNSIPVDRSNKSQSYYLYRIKSFKGILILSAHREVASEMLLKRHDQLKTLGSTNEHAIHQQPHFRSAKKNNLKTYGIQHGGINKNNMFYYFIDKDRKYKPWPNKTFIRGSFTFKMLTTHSAYKEDELQVVGHLRTDAIPSLDTLKPSRIFKDYIEGQKVITYATQLPPESELHYIHRQSHDFFKVASKYPSELFVIKPHPYETDFSHHHKYAEQYGVKNYRIIQPDLYQLLAVSDVVITYFSTVGLEAVYFNKPLIVLDYSNLDSQGYIQSGVGFKASNYDQFNSIFDQIVSGAIKTNESKRDTFIEARAYKIDGNVKNRIFSEVKKLN